MQERLGPEIPQQNFSRGLLEADMPAWMGQVARGKVRDNWVAKLRGEEYRVQVTTDRLSAFDKVVCAVPGKGKVLNMMSSFWFDETSDIIPNHKIHIPHPNVLIGEEAEAVKVEFIFRRYISRTDSTTSIYHHYFNLGEREIYGYKFPNNLQPNQELPMGPIVTPTTKEGEGHDQILTNKQAEELVDSQHGNGMYKNLSDLGLAIYQRGFDVSLGKGLIVSDTKLEFGLRKDGTPIVIDELITPDSSRFWFADSYKERFDKGEDPKAYDKEIIRKWLAENGFTGDGPVPAIPPEKIDEIADAYNVPYRMITGKDVPGNPSKAVSVRDYTGRYFQNL